MTGKELVVSLLGMPIGRLVPTRRGARFSYESEVAREHVGMPLLSLSLPVKARPYTEVGRTHLLAEARSWGMPPSDAEKTIDTTLERLAVGLACQRDVYPDAARRHEPGARRRLDALREHS